MSSETNLDLSQIIQNIKRNKPSFDLNSVDARHALKAVKEGLSNPANVVDLPGIHIDQNSGEDERKTLQMLFADNPDLLRELLKHAIAGGGGGGGASTNKTTTKKAATDYITVKQNIKKLTKSSIKNIERYLSRYLDYIDAEYVEDIDNTKHTLYPDFLEKEGLSGSSRNNEIATVNNFVKYLGPKDQKIIDLSFLYTVPQKVVDEEKKERLYFKQKHYKDIKNTLISLKNDQQRLLVILAFITGARRGELGLIETKDFLIEKSDDPNKTHIYYFSINNILEDEDKYDESEIEKTVKNSGSKRHIPIPDKLVPFIIKIHEQAKSKSGTDLFFDIETNKKGKGETVSRAFIYQIRKRGYESEYVLHSARHTFRTIVDDNFSESRIDKLMGYTAETISKKVYLHQELEHLKPLVEYAFDEHFSDFLETLKMKV
ncbi:MAG: tyrosine-type recombinase/integrase [Neptuniibacter sp.]